MERIAPLAKILAEANGIDWQKLHGTGEGGMIVEQDILNYLSRIMSGEEEPPTTPVDAPPANWDGRDIVPSADMLKGAGVDSDIAAFVEQSRPAPAAAMPAVSPAPHLPVTPSSPNLEADALEFELEDEPPAPPAPPVAAPPAWDWNAPMPAVSAPSVPEVPSIPDVQVPHTPEAAPISTPAPVVPPSMPEAGPSAPAVAAGAVATGGLGLGSLLSKLYHKEEEKPAPPVATPAVAHAEEPAVPSVPAPTEPAAFEPLHTEPVMEAPAPAAEPMPETSNAPTWTAPAAPEVAQPEVHHEPAPLHDAPTAHEHGTHGHSAHEHHGHDHHAHEHASHEHAPAEPAAEPAAAAAEVVTAEPVAHEPVAQEPVTEEPVTAEPAHAAPQPDMHEPQATPAHEPVAPEHEEAAVAAAPVAERPAGQPAESVWFGTYLRREANLGPAGEVRHQLHGALGRDLPLAFLVARAAQRHLDLLDLHSVALHDLDAQRARQVHASRLSDALIALDADHDGTPDLLVVDAGQLDLDDLHYPHTTTLSVGRVHEGRAALTLNGNVDAAQAARFLAKVSEALEQPLVLVL